MTTYYESASGIVIDRERAIKEVKAHCADVNEFLKDCGDCPTYTAQFVLEWLGY